MILFVNRGDDDLFYWCSDLKQTSQNDYVNANFFLFFANCGGSCNSALPSDVSSSRSSIFPWLATHVRIRGLVVEAALDSSCFVWSYGNFLLLVFLWKLIFGNADLIPTFLKTLLVVPVIQCWGCCILEMIAAFFNFCQPVKLRFQSVLII